MSTLVAYADLAYHIVDARNDGWVTMFAPKCEEVNKGMLIENVGNYADIYGLDFIMCKDYYVRVHYNAKDKVNIRCRFPITIQLAKDSNNTTFEGFYYKELLQSPIVARQISNASVIECGPVDTFDLYLRTYIGLDGERLHLQTLHSDGNFYDRLTISNYENPARVSIKNAVLNIQKDLQHATPKEGDIKLDSETNRLYVYINGAWRYVTLT
jgi:hypothetical protein